MCKMHKFMSYPQNVRSFDASTKIYIKTQKNMLIMLISLLINHFITDFCRKSYVNNFLDDTYVKYARKIQFCAKYIKRRKKS